MGPRGQFRLAALLIASLLPAFLFAQESPQRLVEETIYNELHAAKHPYYWAYRDSNTEAGTTKLRRVVQTPECWFSYVMAIDGKPLSPAQQQQQQADIDNLLNDASARNKNRADLHQDGKQAEDLMKMLPTIFVYTADGEQNGNIRLKFRPNPNFDPPTHAAKVFHNMQGTLLINKREKRLAGMDGTLMQDVTFGWGVLGRLTKGGTFKVAQTEVGPKDWEVTLLDVHIHGHALFFHTISEDQHEVKSEFQQVPRDIGLTQAASLAEHGSETVAASAH